ncbi:MAG TPA: antibiotic biosynthesis monooxygenase [Candidatus Binataceae bacterium]|nr:antibiotic biosynthesis monooxygenase [Candidatus Binataceae bacterium]
MFAVIFEVQPRQERWEEYLGLARLLRPELEQIEGFIENERFVHQADGSRLLSLSLWDNEKALVRWRTVPLHHEAQERGRREILADYHLRVGEVIGDSARPPIDLLAGQRFDVTQSGAAPVATISIVVPPARSLPEVGEASAAITCDRFTSLTTEGKELVLRGWRETEAAVDWERALGRKSDLIRHLRVRIIRDYGMVDRREAPQYFPPVPARPNPK